MKVHVFQAYVVYRGFVAVVTALLLPTIIAGRVEAASNPTTGKSLVFNDEFTGSSLSSRWAVQTAAYASCTRNPSNGKLDNLTRSSMTLSGGVLNIRATKRSDGYWNTGLLTTGDSCGTGGSGFRVRAGDFFVTHAMMPKENLGAWPALWTWRDGDNEIDAFEWHSDNPSILELNNHVKSGSKYYDNSALVGKGKWLYIGTKVGATSNTWYVGTSLSNLKPVYSDGKGVGTGWGGAYLIINLSISSGKWHSKPSSSTPINFKVGSVKVYR